MAVLGPGKVVLPPLAGRGQCQCSGQGYARMLGIKVSENPLQDHW